MAQREGLRGASILGLALLSACSSSNIPRPDFASATHAGHRAATAVSDQADERFPGVSAAVKAPLRDFNMIEDDVPVVLVRAYQHPYDAAGLGSCDAVQAQISALDLALGPDVDIPTASMGGNGLMARGRTLAAEGALDAVRSATTGAIPVRSWVRRLSGATRDEKELKAVVLSGAVRRGFLKAVGLALRCEWPAAPLDLQSAQLKLKTLNNAQREALGGAPLAGPGADAPR